MSGPMPLWPLGAMTPMTLNGWLRMRMTWPTGSASASEQDVVDGLAEHRDLGRARHVLRAEEAADPRRPRADERQVDVGALDAREPVLIAGDDLRLHADAGRQILHARHLVADRVGVLRRQRARRARAAAHAALRRVAGVDGDHVGAGALDLIFDHRLRAVAHRHERDHGRHADDHAEHRQAGPHLVAAERLERDPKRHDW